MVGAQHSRPFVAIALGRFTRRVRQNRCAFFGSIQGIQDNESRVIHPTIGINKTFSEFRLQWFACCVRAQIEAA